MLRGGKPTAYRSSLISAFAGQPARMSLSIAYASPEIVMAYQEGKHMVIADRAVDTWSLGIMAWELFTGNRVFPRGTPKEAVSLSLSVHSLSVQTFQK